MKIPESAADTENNDLPDENEAYIKNPYPGRELLTKSEALNMMNIVSGQLMADGYVRRSKDN